MPPASNEITLDFADALHKMIKPKFQYFWPMFSYVTDLFSFFVFGSLSET